MIVQRRFYCLTVFLLGISGALSCQSVPDSGMERPESGFIGTADSVKLYYRKVGDGPQKVLLPGDFLLYDDFRHLAEGRTLVFYDMRNRGRSKPVYDRDKISVWHDVGDLEEVRAFFGFEKVSLLGYSYLGKMAVMYALEHPGRVERIIQIGPVPIKFGTEYPAELTANDRGPVMDEQALAELRKKREQNFHLTHPREYCEEEWMITRVRLVGDPVYADSMGSSNCHLPNEWPTHLARHLSAHLATMQKAGLTMSELNELRKPVLTVHGTKDRNAPYGSGREWALHLPEGRLLTVKGAAHRVWTGNRDFVFTSIDTFLDGNWPEAAEEVK